MVTSVMRRLILLAVVMCGSFGWQAQARCLQSWACVDKQIADNGEVNVYLRNNKPFTITMTVDVNTVNLASDQQDPVTKTLEGNSRVWIARYQPVNKRRRTAIDFNIQWAVGSLDVVHDDDYLYRLPFNTSAGHYVVQGFNGGYSHRGFSKYGVDFSMPDGTELYAAREGTVVDVEYRNYRGGASRKYAKYANFIVIEHSDGSTGEYYHLQQDGVFVRPGDKVKRGQLIGLSGSTGFTSVPHLHFAVYKALAKGETQSLAFKFVSATGIVTNPRYGKRYKAAEDD